VFGLINATLRAFVIGVVVDALLFGKIERAIRRRYGLLDEATA